MMKPQQLIGEGIQLLVGDPWEFVTEHGAGPFLGTIVATNDDKWLVKLREPFMVNGSSFTHAWLASRYKGFPLRKAFDGEVTAACTAVPTQSVPFEEADSRDSEFPWFIAQIAPIGHGSGH